MLLPFHDRTNGWPRSISYPHVRGKWKSSEFVFTRISPERSFSKKIISDKQHIRNNRKYVTEFTFRSKGEKWYFEELDSTTTSFRVGVPKEGGGDKHLSIKSVTGCPERNTPFPVEVGGGRARRCVCVHTRTWTMSRRRPSLHELLTAKLRLERSRRRNGFSVRYEVCGDLPDHR